MNNSAQNSKVRFGGTYLEYDFKPRNTKAISLIVLTTGVTIVGVMVWWIVSIYS